MRGWTRRSLLAGLLATPLAFTGCSILELAYFLAPEPKIPPKLGQIANTEVGEIPRVVILASMTGLVTEPTLTQADRELSTYLAKHLYEHCLINQENLTIVSPPKVDNYKSSNPNWKQKHPREIGQKFNADYVIHLEINSIKMYEPGSGRELFQGQTEINVTLVDVDNPDAIPNQTTFHSVYPKGHPVLSDIDTSPAKFRAAFLQDVALDLAWHFTSHTKRQEYSRK